MPYTDNTIEEILGSFKDIIGQDYDKYRNHVYRVFYYCLLMDKTAANEVKYAIAAAFHDIGIWTGNTIDYLAPSMHRAQQYLYERGKPYWIDEIQTMIYWHHKAGRYIGKFEETTECFRKADYADVSLGLITFGISKASIKQYRQQFPYLGFHRFLVRKIFRNLFRHPFHPLPMFKR